MAVSFPDWKTTNWLPPMDQGQPISAHKKSKRYSSNIIAEYVFDSVLDIVNSHAIEIETKILCRLVEGYFNHSEEKNQRVEPERNRFILEKFRKEAREMTKKDDSHRIIISKVRGILSHVRDEKKKSNLNPIRFQIFSHVERDRKEVYFLSANPKSWTSERYFPIFAIIIPSSTNETTTTTRH